MADAFQRLARRFGWARICVGGHVGGKPPDGGAQPTYSRLLAPTQLARRIAADAVNAFAQSPALEIFTASRKEAAERREKFFIQSDLRLGLAAGFGGFGVIADEHARSGSTQRRTRR